MGQTQGGYIYAPGVSSNGPLVVLNVYDLDKNWLKMNGLLCDALQLGGAFHVGVEIFGNEWSFGTEGVGYSHARHHDVHVYRQSIPLGYTKYNAEKVTEIIDDMASSGGWRGETYDILFKNCCSFAREFCCNMLGRDKIPGWVDRLGNGLAEVFGPAGMTGASTPGLLGLPRARTFAHVRQESTTSQVSEAEDEYAEPSGAKSQLHHTQPIHRTLLSSHSFALPSHSLQKTSAASRYSHPISYPTSSTVCQPSPLAFAPGVRRFVSAVY